MFSAEDMALLSLKGADIRVCSIEDNLGAIAPAEHFGVVLV